jgi:hypothetical protein
MGCLGVHFALSPDEVATLKSLDEDENRLNHIREVVEEDYFLNHSELLAQSDKAWDAMHRGLADGELTWDGGQYPLNHVVLAGESLYDGDDYIASLKTPDQVRDIASTLATLTESAFRRRYFAIDPQDYGMALSEEDFGYTWTNFESVRALYQRAALDGRYVLFTADQ